jgi:phosphomannomutase
MTINSAIFKAYDIRGVYPTDINEESAVTIARAIYSFFARRVGKKNISIVLGQDMRLSSPALFKVVSETLVRCGAYVIDIGLVSTPTFYFASLKYDCNAGIMITASHNPKDYNGFKFVLREGSRLIKIGKPTGMEDVKKIAAAADFEPDSSGGKITTQLNAITDEAANALKAVNIPTGRKLKIITDTANGMAVTYINALLKTQNVELIHLNPKLDGTFPVHEANPLKFDTLVDLQKKVVAEHADLGIAPDADGDRIFFIDEKGNVIWATMITALISSEILKSDPTARIIVDIRYLKNVSNIVKKLNGKLSISRVGHAFISAQMPVEQAVFAGESSGHYFFRETGYAESSSLVLAHVLKVLIRENKPFSEIVSQFRTAEESGEYNFEIIGLDVVKITQELKNKYKGELSELDGLSISFPDWRFNVRTSNTEPLLRLNVEADSRSVLDDQLKKLLNELEKMGAKKV